MVAISCSHTDNMRNWISVSEGVFLRRVVLSKCGAGVMLVLPLFFFFFLPPSLSLFYLLNTPAVNNLTVCHPCRPILSAQTGALLKKEKH